MRYATIIDVGSGCGYEGDQRIRREYERRIERLSGRYAYDIIAGARYWRENGRDQILGYSVRLPLELAGILDDEMEAAFRVVEKARARERTAKAA